METRINDTPPDPALPGRAVFCYFPNFREFTLIYCTWPNEHFSNIEVNVDER